MNYHLIIYDISNFYLIYLGRKRQLKNKVSCVNMWVSLDAKSFLFFSFVHTILPIIYFCAVCVLFFFENGILIFMKSKSESPKDRIHFLIHKI